MDRFSVSSFSPRSPPVRVGHVIARRRGRERSTAPALAAGQTSRKGHRLTPSGQCDGSGKLVGVRPFHRDAVEDLRIVPILVAEDRSRRSAPPTGRRVRRLEGSVAIPVAFGERQLRRRPQDVQTLASVQPVRLRQVETSSHRGDRRRAGSCSTQDVLNGPEHVDGRVSRRHDGAMLDVTPDDVPCSGQASTWSGPSWASSSRTRIEHVAHVGVFADLVERAGRRRSRLRPAGAPACSRRRWRIERPM